MVTGEGVLSREGPTLQERSQVRGLEAEWEDQAGGKPHPPNGGVNRASTQPGILVDIRLLCSF